MLSLVQVSLQPQELSQPYHQHLSHCSQGLSSISFFLVTSSYSGSRNLSGQHGFSSCCAREPPAWAPCPGSFRDFQGLFVLAGFAQGFIFCFPPSSAKGSWEKNLTVTLHLQAHPSHSTSGTSPQQPQSLDLGLDWTLGDKTSNPPQILIFSP